MKTGSFFTVCLLVHFFVAIAFAGPAADTFIGKVKVGPAGKLDGQAKREVAAFAAKIKKSLKSGTVKLVGDVPSAGSPEDYLTQSFLLAKVVQDHLKTLLPNKFQIFLTASRYNGDQGAENNQVSVFLYPYELKAEGLNFISSQLKTEKPAGVAVTAPPSPAAVSPVGQIPADSSLSLPLSSDYDRSAPKSRREREVAETEDPVKANELVNRAKARAAEKARRRKSQD